jgi:hypothetical protein
MITEQPYRLRLRLLVVPARHGAILPNKEGAHQTRDGSGIHHAALSVRPDCSDRAVAVHKGAQVAIGGGWRGPPPDTLDHVPAARPIQVRR